MALSWSKVGRQGLNRVTMQHDKISSMFDRKSFIRESERAKEGGDSGLVVIITDYCT